MKVITVEDYIFNILNLCITVCLYYKLSICYCIKLSVINERKMTVCIVVVCIVITVVIYQYMISIVYW